MTQKISCNSKLTLSRSLISRTMSELLRAPSNPTPIRVSVNATVQARPINVHSWHFFITTIGTLFRRQVRRLRQVFGNLSTSQTAPACVYTSRQTNWRMGNRSHPDRPKKNLSPASLFFDPFAALPSFLACICFSFFQDRTPRSSSPRCRCCWRSWVGKPLEERSAGFRREARNGKKAAARRCVWRL